MSSARLIGLITQMRTLQRDAPLLTHRRFFHKTYLVASGNRKNRSSLPFQSELENPVNTVFGSEENWPADEFGKIFDKKPTKVSVKKYHEYKWCGCGWSHSQPFCDTTCKHFAYKAVISGGGPLTYIAPEDKDVWFCNCKRTKRRPFCDGTHRDKEIQEENIDGKFDLWEPKSTP